jgi:hypothetical protein
MNIKKLFGFKLFSPFSSRGGFAGETTVTTMTEAIPVAVSAALLEIEEGDVIKPLVTNVAFPGPGIVHSTPIISKLVSESDDSLANQEIDSGTYTGSPSQATVGVHGITVFLKELAVIGTVDDLMAVAGQLIGQGIVTRRDKDLAALFTSITAIEGTANTDILPSHFFSAFNKLRIQNAPMPYYMVIHPGHIWSAIGITKAFSNVASANNYPYAAAGGPGSVGEDIMRNGFAGKMFGFEIYSDSNLTVTSRNASGAAFSREAIKYVPKRGFVVDVLRSGPEVGWQVTGSEMWGEAILKNNFGVEMQFNTSP